jgi:hypothetical protein
VTSGRRPYVAWAVLGALSVVSMWFAASVPGAIGIFACIGAAFALWYGVGSRGWWLALVVVGFGMGGLLGWQALHGGSRCPAAGTKVFMSANRAPISCRDVRASAAVMAIFFMLLAGIGIGVPIHTGSTSDDEAEPDKAG